MEEKKCFKCNAVKPLSDFYKHAQMKDGHLNKCKECAKTDSIEIRNNSIESHREYDRNRASLPHRVKARKDLYNSKKDTAEYKKSHYNSTQKYRKNNPKKIKAERAVQYALLSGKINKLPCSVCGSNKAEAHHPDYDFPLGIVWLCGKHHREEHVKTGSFRKKD